MNSLSTLRLRRALQGAVVSTVLCSALAWSADTAIGDTSASSHEVAFCSGAAAPYAGCTASDLRSRADSLASPVGIYEFVRNNYDFALYHGARSGAINTFLGGRGNDVDLAATLISMLRSQGIPARYVVGTVRVPAAQVTNWLAVKNADLAYGMLRDQGVQGVVLAADKSTLDFEHTWVEALVPYGNYRGAGPKSVDCTASPSLCSWVPLDPSFKQRNQRSSGLDPYNALSFDYTAYYNALKNNDAARRDKSPLEIYQEQVLAWLQTTAPGKTLQDIPDFTGIIPQADGLLPASLPFVTLGSLRRYNSVADHDSAVPATEPKKWLKTVTAQAMFGTSISLGSATVSLVDAATKRFTFTFSQTGSNMAELFRLDGTQVGSGLILNGGTLTVNGQTVTLGTPFSLVVSMDGAPAADAADTDEVISATYSAIVGGYYLIATGGETSNWSQVHRAAQQLLAADQQYKVVFNPADPGLNGQPCDFTSGMNCTPYVDANGNGWDATDPKLLDSPAALDAMTGGLLYVAGTQYYANFRNKVAQLDAIDKTRSPITGFLGVVSTTHDVEYIDGTAFSVLPGGLLIDMKGLHFSGAWRIDQASVYSNKHFDLIGHVMSSLEHETWQELTGFDAISTVRGIQMALNNGATLANPLKNAATDTMGSIYSSFNYASSAPAGFTRNVRTLFNRNYLSWSNPNSAASFVAFRPNVQGYATTDPNLTYWTYNASAGIDSFLATYDGLENQLLTLQPTMGQLKTNVPINSTWTAYQTADVLSATTSTAGFSVASYTRTATNAYTFYVNETSNHADGVYSVVINLSLGDAINEATYTINGLTGAIVYGASVTSPANFAVKSYSTAATDPHTVTLKETAAHAAGTYPVVVKLNWISGSYLYSGSLTLNVTVAANGRWVDSTGTVTSSVDVSDNYSITCAGGANGASVTYTGTPTVLLGNLQGCFNNVVTLNAWGDAFNFFDPTATLVFRASPAANDDQLTSKVVGMRNDEYLRDQSVNWIEYLIPTKLSVGPMYRFGVDLRKVHETATSNVVQATYEIVNDWGVAAGGGFVTPRQRSKNQVSTPVPAQTRK